MDAPLWRNAVLGNGGAIRSRGTPFRHQRPNTIHILGIWIEDRVDFTRRAHDAMPDQRNPTDQHVADFRAVEVFEDAGEAGQLGLEASSIAIWEIAMPSARSSSGSRVTFLIKR